MVWCGVVLFDVVRAVTLLTPSYRWLTAEPEPPIVDLGHCSPNGTEKLLIGQIRLTPGTMAGGVAITFSTNMVTNNLIAIQYGTKKERLDFETFASSNKVWKVGRWLWDFMILYSIYDIFWSWI